MKHVLILGAGKSSHHLIKYLASNTIRLQSNLTIADINISEIELIYQNYEHVHFQSIIANDFNSIEKCIENKNIVISMLPAFMHIDVAKLCLKLGTHLITPSYVSDEMKELDSMAKEKNLLFFNELGFDPGIDHMTTMKIYNDIVSKGGVLKSYKSYAGGLVAEKSDNNPWNYKFSWNPRNVILAGQGATIKYKEHGSEKYIPYYSLFKRFETIKLQNGSILDAYANRDSLKYESIYGWKNVETLLRGTLRKKGFCNAWNILVELGLTDDTFILKETNKLSYFDFFSRFYTLNSQNTPQNNFATLINTAIDSELFKKFEYIGFFDTKSTIELKEGSPASILQSILEKKWLLEDIDTDWIIMVHFLEYTLDGKKYNIESSLSLEGQDNYFTAMSRTVGMPIAYACELMLQDKIKATGVQIPIHKELYTPILEKLEQEGIHFIESITEINI